MGQFTPNIGLYIPSAGETNYNDAFAQGMINLDQHDHTGGPNKGLPITSSGLANFSVTFDKLASNVADPTTGIGVNSTPGSQNQLQILGILRNLFTLAAVPGVGFVSMNGSTVAARTFQNSLDGSITWSFPDGVGGNPVPAFNIGGISPVTVPNGGTGLTSLVPYSLIAGGVTSAGNVQQVASLGTLNQYLASNGAANLPTWKNLPTITQNVQLASVTISAAQFGALSGTPIVLVPAQGAGIVTVVLNCWGKLNYANSDNFHSGSAVGLYWGSGSTQVGFQFNSGAFKDGASSVASFYYTSDQFDTSSSTGLTTATVENRNVTVSVSGSNYSGGAGNTVTIWCAYTSMQI